VELTVEPDRTGRLDVDGCPIAWAAWHPVPPAAGDGPPIVLVHGASAHLGWWDAVIPRLLDDGRQVVALELSGHGDSGRRPAYSGELWAREVLAVIEQVAGRPSLLVGHSLGGRVAVLAAARSAALVPRLVLVDAALHAPGGPPRRRIPARLGPRTVHPSLTAAVEAFRLRPREPVARGELLRRVAAGAYRPQSGGWTLKADLAVFNRIGDDELAAALAGVAQPITMVYGTMSAIVDEDGLAFLQCTHPGETEFIAVEGHHHLTFDQAEAVAEIIRGRWAVMVSRGA
jgi:pimeloyl-ACP methyl ester carboxylesterase